jgi:hypothetical protein
VVGEPWDRKLVGVVQVNAGPTARGLLLVLETAGVPAAGGAEVGGARPPSPGTVDALPGVVVVAMVAPVVVVAEAVSPLMVAAVVDVPCVVALTVGLDDPDSRAGAIVVVDEVGAAAEMDTTFGIEKAAIAATPAVAVRKPGFHRQTRRTELSR